MQGKWSPAKARTSDGPWAQGLVAHQAAVGSLGVCTVTCPDWCFVGDQTSSVVSCFVVLSSSAGKPSFIPGAGEIPQGLSPHAAPEPSQLISPMLDAHDLTATPAGSGGQAVPPVWGGAGRAPPEHFLPSALLTAGTMPCQLGLGVARVPHQPSEHPTG